MAESDAPVRTVVAAPPEWTKARSDAFLEMFAPGRPAPPEPAVPERGRQAHAAVVDEFLAGAEEMVARIRDGSCLAFEAHGDPATRALYEAASLSANDVFGSGTNTTAGSTPLVTAESPDPKALTAVMLPAPATGACVALSAPFSWDTLRERQLRLRPRDEAELTDSDETDEDGTWSDSSAEYDSPEPITAELPDNALLIAEMERVEAELLTVHRSLMAVERFWYFHALLRARPEAPLHDAVNKVGGALNGLVRGVNAMRLSLLTYFNDRSRGERATRKFPDSPALWDLVVALDRKAWLAVHQSWQNLERTVFLAYHVLHNNAEIAQKVGEKKQDAVAMSGMFM